MGHVVDNKEEVYRALAERLHRNPVGAPVNAILMEILYRLYTLNEARVAGRLPLTPVPLGKLADITGHKERELETLLDGMADKGLVLDFPRKNKTLYMLAPMVIGFFEYTFMRVRDTVDMRELAELFEIYFQKPEVREELAGGNTKIFQTLVYESLIPAAVETEVLDYERASQIIRDSGGGAISLCSCRHKASHLGKACGAPMEVCTSMGNAARWLVRRGMGRPATVDDLLRVLEQTEKLGLVHLGDNVLNQPAYICHCCGCCCQVLISARETGNCSAVPSNFLPSLKNADNCNGCGLCAESCHIKAIAMVEAGHGEDALGGGIVSGLSEVTRVSKLPRVSEVPRVSKLPRVNKVPQFNEDFCIGCGVCASTCPKDTLVMSRKTSLHVPPADKREQFARIAREKGRA